eukprot:CAMPEP_0184401098 /NCGR_PEP_ID=MMETSP0007-20130409/77640_1 /TAXON_ID=97485 /ORGANISM="Prymnesium parvum, Strain Texoma1" /LENGTH=86 /DNA_ID=CAMNT_0026756335 /DNA_START=306 /DNA_END=562 /DNA_ORIENTATION=+
MHTSRLDPPISAAVLKEHGAAGDRLDAQPSLSALCSEREVRGAARAVRHGAQVDEAGEPPLAAVGQLVGVARVEEVGVQCVQLARA